MVSDDSMMRADNKILAGYHMGKVRRSMLLFRLGSDFIHGSHRCFSLSFRISETAASSVYIIDV